VAEPEAFQHHRLDDTETGNKLQVGQFLIGIMITDEVQVVQMSVLPHVEDPGVDGRIILSWIFRKWDVEVWTGSIWLRIGTGGGYLGMW